MKDERVEIRVVIGDTEIKRTTDKLDLSLQYGLAPDYETKVFSGYAALEIFQDREPTWKRSMSNDLMVFVKSLAMSELIRLQDIFGSVYTAEQIEEEFCKDVRIYLTHIK